MDEEREEVLYEIRRHVSRSLPVDSSTNQTSEGQSGSGFLSYLSFQGVTKIKEKWSAYYGANISRREISLIVSPNGKFVAVCANNLIIMLTKENNYMEPFGVYTNNERSVVFTNGAWLETEGIFVIIDNSNNLYMIKSNGEQIVKKNSKQLKISLPISGILIIEDQISDRSLGNITIFTSDSLTHQFGVTKEENGSISINSIYDLNNNSALIKAGQLPVHVACLDFNPNLSLLALIGSSNPNSGSYSLYLLQVNKNSELKFLVRGLEFKGSFSFSPQKDQNTPDSNPRVQISPQGKYIATLDSLGSLKIFKFELNSNSLSHDLSLEREELLNNLLDFTWWTGDILTLANKGKNVILYDLMSNKKVSQNDTLVSNSDMILEGIKNQSGRVFIWSQKEGENDNIWTLISLNGVSIPEMYKVIIKNKNYEKALDFASKYGLDKDEVFKGQWADSNKDNYEINSSLSRISDKIFILSECVNCVGPTESALRALISFGFNITDKYKFIDESLLAWKMRIFRLRLLNCKDRLETFLGINMGRFSEEEYSKFLSLPLVKTAIFLAENGKIGALNLLFKRHPYTISSNILQILSSVPETVPVHSYSQLLPGRNPPNSTLLREPDWIECDKMVYYIQESINQSENTEKIKTEIILKISEGFVWPSVDQISNWYINRAREMDSLSGQLDNSISLMELAAQKGLNGVVQFLDETKYLCHLVYSKEVADFTMDLATWESLSKYEKFKLLLKGAKGENIAQKLREKAVPYMLKYREKDERETETYLVKWVKEQARENNLSICLGVFAIACGNQNAINGLFRGVLEIVQTGCECVYTCGATDKWSVMGNILSNLLNLISRERVSGECLVSADFLENLERKVRVSQGHVEVGRLLAYYQVPKPMGFFINSQSEEKNIHNIIRLILSKFSRRQPGRSDGDWAAMWRDLLILHEKAFSFLDSEFLLTEFVRGLLKAGKFSLARNYLRGTSAVNLPSDKSESLVISVAKEYFFSASSLSSSEIWKAKECLSLLPNNIKVQAEMDLIDALTIRLPELGITLLPMEFKQKKDPIEIIKTILTSQSGAYLNIEEMIDISKLLGLKSEEEISAVEELIAREAVLNGDFQLGSDLCSALVKKGHGPIWDLCVCISRVENRDLESRKRFLGFALNHCDEQSVGELLSAWKDLEIKENFERVRDFGANRGKSKSDFGKFTEKKLMEMVCEVCDEMPKEEKERKKILSFVEKELVWLMKLCDKEESGKKIIPKMPSKRHYFSAKTRAINSIISWLVTNGFSPKDELITNLAKSVVGPPVNEDDDKLGLLFLLNLVNPLGGVSVIEEEIKKRNEYCEIHSMMSVGMAFSSLNNSSKECNSPQERRDLLSLGIFDKLSSLDSDEMDEMEEKQNTFWKEWKVKLEEEKRANEQTRALLQIIPGTEASRFLSGDKDYVKNAIFSFIDSVKLEKKYILKEAVKLADNYGLPRTEVLLHFFGCVLVSDCWENQDILSEIKEFRDEIAKSAMDVVHVISESVYPQISGKNKQRLSYIFSILSACHSRLKHSLDPVYIKCMDQEHHLHVLEPFQYYKVLEIESLRVSFINDLDFKNIAGLQDLNFEGFNQEISGKVSEETVDALAELAGSLVGIYDSALLKGLILKEGVYKHYILGLLASLEGRNEARPSNYIEPLALQNLIREIEISFDKCEKYINFLSGSDISSIIGKYFTLCLAVNFSRDPLDDPNWKETLFVLIHFWTKLLRKIPDKISVVNCLKTFEGLLSEGFVSINQGWEMVSRFLKLRFLNGLSSDNLFFCKSMILSGCEFESIGDIYSQNQSQNFNLTELYNDVASSCLSGLINGSDSIDDLYSLLSSLSKFTEKHSENLKIVRSEIWGQLCNFLERKELENHTRVFALQLMQAITGQNTKILPYEIISLVEKWESWDESYTINNKNNDHNNNDNDDGNNSGIVQENAVLFSSSITSTLIALKSTQLISSIFPNVEITPDDLQTLDSAVSRFLQLSEAISEKISVEKINILEAVLEEWEPLFCPNQEKSNNSDDQIELNNNANNDNNDHNDDDGWDNDEWETFPDEVVNENKSEIKSDLISVIPLHICWTDLVHKLITIGEINKTIKLFDQSIYKSRPLLDEQESSHLIQLFGKKDPFLILKLVSIMPHERPLNQCLQQIETKLKNSTVYDASHNNDYELLALVLYSGFLHTGPSTYPKLFSYLCYLIGHLARLCQNGIVEGFNSGGQNWKEKMLFVHVLFPYFISELVIKGEFLLAGFMVSKWNHTNGSLGLIDVVHVSVRKYLENQIVVRNENQEADLSGTIGFVVSVLKSRLSSVLQSAVLALGKESES